MRLEDWEIFEYGGNNIIMAHGDIYDDENGRFDDGENIRTSYLLGINDDLTEIHTRNNVYKLGKPSLFFAEKMRSDGAWLDKLRNMAVEKKASKEVN